MITINLMTVVISVIGCMCGILLVRLLRLLARRIKYGKTEDFDLHAYLDKDKDNNE